MSNVLRNLTLVLGLDGGPIAVLPHLQEPIIFTEFRTITCVKRKKASIPPLVIWVEFCKQSLT